MQEYYQKLLEQVEERLLTEDEDRTIELSYIYESIYQFLYIALYHTDDILPGEKETNVVNWMVQVLEDWLLHTEVEHARIGILYGLAKTYLRYSCIKGLTDRDYLEIASKKQTVLECLQNYYSPSWGTYTGETFGRITSEQIDRLV